MSAPPAWTAWLAYGDAACRFLFLNWAFHATCLLGGGIAVSRLPKLRASVRHGILASALLLAALSPIARLLPLPTRTLDVPARLTLPIAPSGVRGPSTIRPQRSPGTVENAQSAIHNPQSAIPVGLLLLASWLLVVAARLISLAHGAWSVARWRRGARPADRHRLYEACGYRLADIPVLEAAAVKVPGVVGLARACILLPEGLTASLDLPALRHVLLHEEAHARRRDPLALFLAELLHSVLFWHPLAAVARRQMEAAAEECCDAHVLACGIQGSDYARTLLTVLEHAAPTGHRAFSCPFGAVGGQLHGRVVRILGGIPPASNAMAMVAGGAILVVTSSSISAQVGSRPQAPRVPRVAAAPVLRQVAELRELRPAMARPVRRRIVAGPLLVRCIRLRLPSPRLLPLVRSTGDLGDPRLGEARSRRPRDGRCIIFALDTSTRMAAYLPEARRMILEQVAGLRPDDRFDVVAFAAEVSRFAETPVAPGEDSRAALEAWLGGLAPGPGSDLGRGLASALEMPEVSSVVLLSDGIATQGITDPEQLLRLVQQENQGGAGIEMLAPAPPSGAFPDVPGEEAAGPAAAPGTADEIRAQRRPDETLLP